MNEGASLKPIRALHIEKLKTPCDLSEAAVEDAISDLSQFGDVARIIIAPQIQAHQAADLAEKFGIGVILTPTMPDLLDVWAISGYTHTIWSEGA